MVAVTVTSVHARSARALSAWLRPVAALGAGLVADRVRPTRVVQVSFAALVAGYLGFVLNEPRPATAALLWAFLLDVFIGPLTGWLLDRSPSVAGHLHVFAGLAAAAGLGASGDPLMRPSCKAWP